MNLKEVIHNAVRTSEAGRHLAETGIQDITDSVVQGLEASGPEGIAEFAKLALTGAPKSARPKPAKPKSATNAAKGQGSRIRGAVSRVLRGEPRPGDHKMLQEDGDRAILFSERLGSTDEEKMLIQKIVKGSDDEPTGFPAAES
jgi:hypothetical protein